MLTAYLWHVELPRHVPEAFEVARAGSCPGGRSSGPRRSSGRAGRFFRPALGVRRAALHRLAVAGVPCAVRLLALAEQRGVLRNWNHYGAQHKLDIDMDLRESDRIAYEGCLGEDGTQEVMLRSAPAGRPKTQADRPHAKNCGTRQLPCYGREAHRHDMSGRPPSRSPRA
ncbi:hypothetical protein SAV31267_001940 [Streptomyces avermitilis]|nr:hypothetical protein SAV31267_001940 [Streptomyces avermitilis]